MENKKNYMAMSAGTVSGKDGAAVPYVFMAEGIVVNDPRYREGADGKPAILGLNVLVGRNPWAMMGKDVEAEQAANPNVSADKPFISLSIFGADATRLKDVPKNAKVVFCGRPVKNAYKKTGTGEDVVALNVNVDGIFVSQNKNADADELRRWVPTFVNQYESQGETKTMNMGLVTVEVTKYNGVRTTQTGQAVVSANVRLPMPNKELDARINRSYDKNADYGTYMEATVSVWGSRATKMENILRAGNRLAIVCTSRTNVGNNNLVYVNLTARDIAVMKWGEAPADGNASNDSNAAPAAPAAAAPAETGGFAPIIDDDEEMDLPF